MTMAGDWYIQPVRLTDHLDMTMPGDWYIQPVRLTDHLDMTMPGDWYIQSPTSLTNKRDDAIFEITSSKIKYHLRSYSLMEESKAFLSFSHLYEIEFACADSESFVRGGPTLSTLFFVRGSGPVLLRNPLFS